MNQLLYKIYLRIRRILENWRKKNERALFIKNVKAKGGLVGKDFNPGLGVVISGEGEVDIGDNVHIGTGSFFRAEGGLSIGNNVVISRNVVLYTISHNYKGKLLPYDEQLIRRPVIIEDNVWIGMNVTIAPGTIIREGAIVGLGARAFGEIQRCAILGSDGKTIGRRHIETYEHLKKAKMFSDNQGNPIP